MSVGRVLGIPLAAALVLTGCNGDLDRARPSPSPASSDPSTLSADLSSFSGRIAFDNFEDVWAIDADGTDLTRLTSAPYPEFDPAWSPDGTEIAFRSERTGEPEI